MQQVFVSLYDASLFPIRHVVKIVSKLSDDFAN